MPIYEVIIGRQPRKVIRKLPRNLRERIIRAAEALAADPRPRGYTRLTGHPDLYRIRVGDWRIAYTIEDDQLLVLVMTVAPRGGAYRTLK